ncbi:MAG: hypothetical protein GY934_10495, partial [Gammaproteobacteria bacterium]|nr:hypothetical protein [Gammaproteobacteria bacterium]
MRLVSFIIKDSGKSTIGSVVDGDYLDLNTLSDGTLPSNMVEFLQEGDTAMQKARDLTASADLSAAYQEDQIELL